MRLGSVVMLGGLATLFAQQPDLAGRLMQAVGGIEGGAGVVTQVTEAVGTGSLTEPLSGLMPAGGVALPLEMLSEMAGSAGPGLGGHGSRRGAGSLAGITSGVEAARIEAQDNADQAAVGRFLAYR